MTTLLSIAGLTKRYGAFTAVDDVHLEVAEGSIHSIIGPNGAGKTSLFNCLSGEIVPDEGRITVGGRDITRAPSNRRVRAGIARSFQITSLFPELTVRENLRIAAQGLRASRAIDFWSPVDLDDASSRTAAEVIERLNLERLAGTTMSQLSHGQQRTLEVGMALAQKPHLILLDEPTSGMGVDDISAMRALVDSLRGSHTVVLVEHNMDIVMGISDLITVMSQGRVLCTGSPAQVQADPRVRAVYLGEAEGA